MTEPEKNKAGLQKKVSSVFKGVPLPQNNSVQQAPGTPTSSSPPGSSAQPPSVDQKAQTSLLKRLQQTEDVPDSTPPDTPPAAELQSAPAERQKRQLPGSKKQAGVSSKEVLSTKSSGSQKPPKVEGPGLWQQINDRLFPPQPGVSPARQKAMVLLIPVLAIVMIFMFRQVLSKSPEQTQAAIDDETPIVGAGKTSDEIDWQIPDPLPAIERDPTKLPNQVVSIISTGTEPNEAVVEPGTEIIDVRDIVFSKDKPSAVINARIVYVGHKVGGATVVRILRDGVEFEKDGKTWVQKVND
jgi:hypothetical protein